MRFAGFSRHARDAGARLPAVVQAVRADIPSSGDGGAIFSDGQLTITGGRISMSSASGAGGGLFNDGSAGLSHSHVLLNSADQGGGGIFNGAGSVALIATTVALNNPDNCEPLHTIAGCFF